MDSGAKFDGSDIRVYLKYGRDEESYPLHLIGHIMVDQDIDNLTSDRLLDLAIMIRAETENRLTSTFFQLDGDVVPARVFIEDLRRRYREKQRLEMADVTREVSEKKVPLDGFTVSSREGKIVVAAASGPG
jgi:hypothetical protein